MTRRPSALPSWGRSFANLLDNPALAGCDSLGLCPAGRGADASIVAAQLGEWMVQASEGVVLLVEADLWRPGLAPLLGSPAGPGLADAMLNPEIAIEEVVHQTRIARLNLLPAGKPVQGRTRHTLAAGFGSYFSRLCGRFPNVIVVLPSATDPECGSFPFSVPGAVLLVVRPLQTSVRDIQWASRRLRETGAALVGTVMDEAAGALAQA
jgi:Mrp family chromosome partitioning ATPase